MDPTSQNLKPYGQHDFKDEIDIDCSDIKIQLPIENSQIKTESLEASLIEPIKQEIKREPGETDVFNNESEVEKDIRKIKLLNPYFLKAEIECEDLPDIIKPEEMLLQSGPSSACITLENQCTKNLKKLTQKSTPKLRNMCSICGKGTNHSVILKSPGESLLVLLVGML
ncbi:uncharacterized protein [Diabrotica undecimpunctata]|uniref:uncharacterized protein n=1 Tax=Diabrotica undecimpunctata TaxID=50387 RepID=UPI003B63D15B